MYPAGERCLGVWDLQVQLYRTAVCDHMHAWLSNIWSSSWHFSACPCSVAACGTP